ncbi:MAG: DUF1669 domain-containing protein [Spirochaetes bacterium]|nr:DUF1669 domain-containing protein [Spirochaetota bacterium]
MKYRTGSVFICLFFCMFSICGSSLYSATEWCDVYFTNPCEGSGEQLGRNNPEIGLLSEISNAKKCFYGAFYDLTSKPLIQELITASRRGVDVKLVIEADNVAKLCTKEFIDSGIRIVTDDRAGLMHNKFAIIDKEKIWTGSYNATYNGGYKNNNNAIRIISKEVSIIYLAEFDEMFKDKIFGNKREYTVFPALMKNNLCRVADTGIEVYFSPEDDIESIIVRKLSEAKDVICFMAFSFTNDRIADELIRLNKSGVSVSGIIERTGANSKYSEYKKLNIEGVQVNLDRNKRIMHHKVIIIDNRLLLTGSYNFSKNANKNNDENLIVVDNKIIAGEYVNEFYKLFLKK